jgi:TorA maturation chaperone TorD
MGDLLWRRGVASIVDQSREQIYGFLAALLSHPDEGKWGRVLNPLAQRSIIAVVDRLRIAAGEFDYPIRENELPPENLDVRSLVLDLCQPLEHLKGEYERVLCGRERPACCSPYELDHCSESHESPVEDLAGFAACYRAFGFLEGERLPARPDHIACELEFMYRLLCHRRLAECLARVDAEAARQAWRCDLAQRNFFGDHLAPWLGAFASSVRECPSGGYFEPLGRFLSAWLPLERYHLGLGGELLNRDHLSELMALGC